METDDYKFRVICRWTTEVNSFSIEGTFLREYFSTTGTPFSVHNEEGVVAHVFSSADSIMMTKRAMTKEYIANTDFSDCVDVPETEYTSGDGEWHPLHTLVMRPYIDSLTDI